jgi:hypothetical protein
VIAAIESEDVRGSATLETVASDMALNVSATLLRNDMTERIAESDIALIESIAVLDLEVGERTELSDKDAMVSLDIR